MEWPGGKYACIHADPPWRWKTWSEKGLDGRPQHYRRMTLAEIMAMPVAAVAAPDSFLFLWITGPSLRKGFSVMDAWGFKYSGIGFSWLKLNPRAGTLFFDERSFFMGGGFTTRKNIELCLVGRRGSPKRISKGVREVIISPRREHSRKPDQTIERIEKFCAGPYLELFARTERPGWTVWGDQIGKFAVAA